MIKKAIPAGALILLGCGFFAGCHGATAKKSGDPVVASFGDTKITADQLDQRIGNRLLSLQTQEFELKERTLRDMIADLLIEREAARLRKSTNELLKAEVEAKITPPKPEEIRAIYEQFKSRVKDRPEADVLKEIERDMTEQKRNERRGAYVKQLSDQAGLRFNLEPPRAKIASLSGPSRGRDNAPVTIVSYSDFQCPWCARAAQTIGRVANHFGDEKLRIVFKNYPLMQIHPQAIKAAEAALCADEQRKFWEMHDKLFATQGNLAAPELKKMAADLKLDEQAFSACLDSGRRAADWQRDIAEGQEIGITSTPSFFVNGRLVSGAQPFERFVEIVDGELQRKTAAK